MSLQEVSKGNVAVISSCSESWGGSEELWGKSVPFLLADGYSVTVYKGMINKEHREFVKLTGMGVELQELEDNKPFVIRNFKKLFRKFENILGRESIFTFYTNPWIDHLIKLLALSKPKFAIISQGINFDGLGYAYACNFLNIPYVIISQKAVDFYWPGPHDRPMMTKILDEAKATYFVSKHNLILTEEQFGKRLANSHVIFNPQKIGKVQPYPDTKEGIKLACVGRLFLLDKGQDILIRILNTEKWRGRPVSVTFVGSGVDEAALKEMAALLGVNSISFSGHIQDMDALWKDYHALVLPSRSEGLPLSMVEAMAAGRIVIISNAGGNTELLDENITGFSGYANEEAFGEAMERAWGKLEEWEDMGKEAAKQVSLRVPQSPEKDFVEHLLHQMNNGRKH
ncbi:glycosyltransferase family 4 protein [Pedobacter sp. AW31-3R]|uniref:glycosyltransferase family 4 protein n=1 Tax=Pedobacter sp. AW31-3R TaxID=3445781 RepID=UPI003F9F358F